MPATWGNDVCPFRPSGCPRRRLARSFPGPLRCLKPAQSPASTMTRWPFGGLMAGESAVFTAATAFSVRMIMDDVSLMRSQSPMHGPCQRRKIFIKQRIGGFAILSEIRHCGGTPHGDARFARPCRLFRIASRGTFCTRILLSWRPARSLHEPTVQKLVSLPDRSRYAFSHRGRQLQELPDPSPYRAVALARSRHPRRPRS